MKKPKTKKLTDEQKTSEYEAKRGARLFRLKRQLCRILKLGKDEKLEIHLWGLSYEARIAEISITSGSGGTSWMQSDPAAFPLLFACERYLIEPEESELTSQLILVEIVGKEIMKP